MKLLKKSKEFTVNSPYTKTAYLGILECDNVYDIALLYEASKGTIFTRKINKYVIVKENIKSIREANDYLDLMADSYEGTSMIKYSFKEL